MWKSLDKPLLNLNKKTLIHGLKTPIYFDGYGSFSFNPQSTRNGPNEFKWFHSMMETQIHVDM